MIDVSQLTNSAQTTTSPGVSSGSDDTLGQDAFLQLMVAQLKNQDPFKPVDASEYLSQLAQFSTVTGVQEMKDSISSLTDSMRSSQVLDGTSLVGHDVLTVSETAKLGTTGEVSGIVELPSGTSEAAIGVTDSSGQLVRRIQLPAQSGSTEFEWDGLADNGTRLAPGTYTLTAVANVGGSVEQVETQLATKVTSVTIDPTNSSLTLNTEIGSVALANVRRVM